MGNIFIISDDIRANHPEFKGQKWICDELKKEFMDAFPNETTNNPLEAGIIWYLAPWKYNYTPKNMTLNEWYALLKYKKVICTQHHIDKNKLEELKPQFNFMNKHANKLHAICDKTAKDMVKYFDKNKIYTKQLWINDKNFYYIRNKDALRKKYKFNKKSHLVGSFQKDTEGKTNLPKLSKGPDLFVKIVQDMYNTNKNVQVVLTGLRREYIINELDKIGIQYYYFNMITSKEINELYNCLDIYLVTSRCEGGPRSVFEAGLTKTPIISTDIGIASELMNKKSSYPSKLTSAVLKNRSSKGRYNIFAGVFMF